MDSLTKYYQAPWSTSLIVISSLATVLCVGAALAMMWSSQGVLPWLALLPLAIVGGGALFTIRGYTVTSDAILVHRLFWTTRLPLAGLKSAQVEPDAMRWSIRTFWQWWTVFLYRVLPQQEIGRLSCVRNDPHQTVVLHFSTRTVAYGLRAPRSSCTILMLRTDAARLVHCGGLLAAG